MYSHLTFPEYVIEVLTNSVQDFQPNYMLRFKRYDAFNTEFPEFENFFSFYSSMLAQAKERAYGKIELRIEPDKPSFKRGFTVYNFYDEIHVNPVFSVNVLIIGKAITLDIPPF